MPKAVEIAHVIYECTDLDKLQQFLLDFGMLIAERTPEQLVMRGAGTSPVLYVARRGKRNVFLGGALEMGSRADLEAVARTAGKPVEEIKDLPGGGWRVRLTTPDNVGIDAIWGQRPAEAVELRDPNQPNQFNAATHKTRLNASLRPRREPGLVLRIGHFGLNVANHEVTRQWFRDHFGLVDSDYLCVPENPEIVFGTFVRFDAGEKFVDHHCMLISQIVYPEHIGIHHCSFEMQDLDAVFGAHDHLLSRGWTLECGIGRHLVGSQIFDYWKDPFGNRIEHYTDGDVANRDYQTLRYAVHADETTQWGMNPPREFFH